MSLCGVRCLPTCRDQVARPKANPSAKTPRATKHASTIVTSMTSLSALGSSPRGPLQEALAVLLLPFLRCLEPEPTLPRLRPLPPSRQHQAQFRGGTCDLAVTLGAPCGAARTGTLSASSWLRSQPPKMHFPWLGSPCKK